MTEWTAGDRGPALPRIACRPQGNQVTDTEPICPFSRDGQTRPYSSNLSVPHGIITALGTPAGDTSTQRDH
jgi:hypothetical protein